MKSTRSILKNVGLIFQRDLYLWEDIQQLKKRRTERNIIRYFVNVVIKFPSVPYNPNYKNTRDLLFILTVNKIKAYELNVAQ